MLFSKIYVKKNPNTDSNIKCFVITKSSFWSYRRLKFQPSNSAAWSMRPKVVLMAERKSAKVSLSSNRLQQTHIIWSLGLYSVTDFSQSITYPNLAHHLAREHTKAWESCIGQGYRIRDLRRFSLVQGLSSLEGSCRPDDLDLTPFLGSSQAKHRKMWSLYLKDVTLEVKLLQHGPWRSCSLPILVSDSNSLY